MMNDPGFWKNVTAFVALASLVAACSTTADSKKTESRAAEAAGAAEKAPSVSEIYERSKRWLPANSQAVVVASGESLWSYAERYLPPTESDEIERGDPGTRQALRRDVAELFRERLGLDPLQVRGAAIGATEKAGTLVAFGDFELGPPASNIEVAGREAYKIVPEPGEYLERRGETELYVSRLEGNAEGLLVAPTESSLKSTIRSAQKTGSEGTLAGTERAETYANLFRATADSGFAVASPIGDVRAAKAASKQGDLPLPDAIVLSVSPSLHLVVHGPTETLNEIQEEVRKQLDTADSTVTSNYETHGEKGLLTALSRISSYHLTKSLLRRLQTERSEGELSYKLDVSTTRIGPMLLGASAAFVLPFVESFLPGEESPLKDAEKKQAKIGADQLRGLIQTYYLMQDAKKLPENLDALVEAEDPLIRDASKLLDPWGNRYIYEPKGEGEFEVYSAGPDGEKGTADDVHP